MNLGTTEINIVGFNVVRQYYTLIFLCQYFHHPCLKKQDEN